MRYHRISKKSSGSDNKQQVQDVGFGKRYYRVALRDNLGIRMINRYVKADSLSDVISAMGIYKRAGWRISSVEVMFRNGFLESMAILGDNLMIV